MGKIKTYRDLKEFIDKLSEEELDQPVTVSPEGGSISEDCWIERAFNNYVWSEEWDECDTEDNFTEEELAEDGVQILIPKGRVFISSY